MSPRFARYVAVGDSFTEGVGDERPDGSCRGWADLVAGRMAAAYANLAVRGKLMGPIVDEQLEPALALRPDLVSLAGGGNDMLRPRADLTAVARLIDLTAARLVDSGATVLMFTAADPCDRLPAGRRIRDKGDELSERVRRIAVRRGAVLADLWAEPRLRDARYWTADRIHLAPAGHALVAALAVTALDETADPTWSDPPAGPDPVPPTRSEQVRYYREFVGPWIRRRLTGTSSGDHRRPKRPTLVAVDPAGPVGSTGQP